MRQGQKKLKTRLRQHGARRAACSARRVRHTQGRPSALSLSEHAGAPAQPLISQITYTPEGQLQSWTWHLSGQSPIPAAQAPNIAPAALLHQRQYDSSARLVRHSLGPHLLRELRYDNASRLVAIQHQRANALPTPGSAPQWHPQPAQDHQYTYDKASRLIRAEVASAQERIRHDYSHDANGNRQSHTQTPLIGPTTTPATTRQATLDAQSNRLLALSAPTIGFAHSADGALQSDTQGFALGTDAAGRVERLRTPQGQHWHYARDNHHLRVRKAQAGSTSPAQTTAQTTTVYVHDARAALAASAEGGPGITSSGTPSGVTPSGPYTAPSYPVLLGEYDGQGQALREYIWLGETPVALVQRTTTTTTTTPSEVLHIHTDHLGTPRLLSDGAGLVRWSWGVGGHSDASGASSSGVRIAAPEPYGASAVQGDPMGVGRVQEQALRMPGQVADGESGLFENHHRLYSPVLGRYVQSDPIGLAGGSWSTYSYGDGDPVRFVDPWGLQITGFTRHGLNCWVSCDHVPVRSWPLFRARDALHGVIDSMRADLTRHPS